MVIAPARRAGDPGSNPGPGENFSLKLLISTCQMVILETKFTFNNNIIQQCTATGKPTGKRPLGRPWRRWEDNMRMDLEEIGINAGNWVESAQDRDYWRVLVNAALNLRVP